MRASQPARSRGPGVLSGLAIASVVTVVLVYLGVRLGLHWWLLVVEDRTGHPRKAADARPDPG